MIMFNGLNLAVIFLKVVIYKLFSNKSYHYPVSECFLSLFLCIRILHPFTDWIQYNGFNVCFIIWRWYQGWFKNDNQYRLDLALFQNLVLVLCATNWYEIQGVNYLGIKPLPPFESLTPFDFSTGEVDSGKFCYTFSGIFLSLHPPPPFDIHF